MDASVSMTNNKKQKLFDEQKIIPSEDRISSLPDEILHYILSFLGTKNVVGTSVLSTRWKYLWTSVPKLDISDSWFCVANPEGRRERKIFRNFVDRVLRLLDVPIIHKCSISLSETHDPTQTSGWIATILKAKVQELKLKICQASDVLPHSFFTNESLKILELQLDYVNIPTSVCFSSLKVLRLDGIGFSCDHSSQQVSLTFPMLDYFLLYECEWVNIKVVNIFAPKLKNFHLIDYGHLRSNEHRDCEIKVYAESLVHLDLWTVLSYEISLYNLSSLVRATFDVPSYEVLQQVPDKIFREICHIKELVLNDYSAAILSNADHSASLLAFSSLNKLRIFIGCTPAIPECCNVTARQLVDLLCHLPTVSSFCFDNGYKESFLKEDEDDHTLEAIPHSVLPHLKLVELDCFHGSKNELYLAQILLNSATALEKMSIIFSTFSEGPREQLESIKKSLMHPTNSKCGVIEFS